MWLYSRSFDSVIVFNCRTSHIFSTRNQVSTWSREQTLHQNWRLCNRSHQENTNAWLYTFHCSETFRQCIQLWYLLLLPSLTFNKIDIITSKNFTSSKLLSAPWCVAGDDILQICQQATHGIHSIALKQKYKSSYINQQSTTTLALPAPIRSMPRFVSYIPALQCPSLQDRYTDVSFMTNL